MAAPHLAHFCQKLACKCHSAPSAI